MNATQEWDTEKNEKKFGLLAIRTVLDKSGRENRKLVEIQLWKDRWRTEIQNDFASPVSFISQSNRHKLKIHDKILEVRSFPSHLKIAF